MKLSEAAQIVQRQAPLFEAIKTLADASQELATLDQAIAERRKAIEELEAQRVKIVGNIAQRQEEGNAAIKASEAERDAVVAQQRAMIAEGEAKLVEIGERITTEAQRLADIEAAITNARTKAGEMLTSLQP